MSSKLLYNLNVPGVKGSVYCGNGKVSKVVAEGIGKKMTAFLENGKIINLIKESVGQKPVIGLPTKQEAEALRAYFGTSVIK